MVQPLWKTDLQWLKNYICNPHMTQPWHSWAFISEKTYVHTKTCAHLFVAALFIVAENWKQRRCPSADAALNRLRSIYTIWVCLGDKRGKNVATHNNLDKPKEFTLSGKKSNPKWLHTGRPYRTLLNGKIIQTENRSVVVGIRDRSYREMAVIIKGYQDICVVTEVVTSCLWWWIPDLTHVMKSCRTEYT